MEDKKPSRSKYKLAVGLEYDAGRQDAPAVAVKADRLLADEVVRVAKKLGVPVVEKADLAQALSRLPVDQSIPEKLYKAVAVLLQVIRSKFGR